MKMSKKNRKQYKDLFTKSEEELQQYFAFRRRKGIVPSKKGKGSFKRKPKHKGMEE
jgi:stalled ribosome alternative rescue factor ArfA